MKIITWNVNGIRAALKKDALAGPLLRVRIGCVCRKLRRGPNSWMRNKRQSLKYPFVWNPGECPGYSGVATFYREKPDEIQFGLDDSRFDTEGRVVRTRQRDFVLYNVYFPNGQRGKNAWNIN